MALGATVYAFKIELADSDRGVYVPLDLRVARHPSETEDHLLTRVLAYCLEYTEGISFSNGLSDPDQPAISIHDLTGVLRVWVDVGAPDAARLHRAAKLAPRVARRCSLEAFVRSAPRTTRSTAVCALSHGGPARLRTGGKIFTARRYTRARAPLRLYTGLLISMLCRIPNGDVFLALLPPPSHHFFR